MSNTVDQRSLISHINTGLIAPSGPLKWLQRLRNDVFGTSQFGNDEVVLTHGI